MATTNTMLSAALSWSEHGFSVIPLRGKKPALRTWQHYQSRKAGTTEIEKWQNAGLLQNIGVVCGAVSGNLAVVDLDGVEATTAFWERFPDLETYHVQTGSGTGQHVYFHLERMTPTTRVVGLKIGNIELRCDGAYVVAPPSLHPSTGRPYVGVGRFIRRVENLDNVAQWIESLRPRPTPTKQSTGVIRNSTFYGRVALDDECGKVRYATEGGRNIQLYRSALKLGTLVQRGHLSESEIEAALLAAAAHLSADDSEAASRRTIQSGLRNARNNGLIGRKSSQA